MKSTAACTSIRLGCADEPPAAKWVLSTSPSLVTAVAMAVSLYFLSLALRILPLGTAYAVWTGIGAVGAAILGMILFGEPSAPLRLASILLIVIGIAGLRLTAA